MMVAKSISRRACALAICGSFALTLCCGSVSAGTFEGVSKSGSVQIFGDLSSFNFETQGSYSETFNESDGADSGDWQSLKKGMNIELPGGSGFGQGIAKQDTSSSGESIKFSGLADVNVSGISSYPVELQGSGGASVKFEYKFRVASIQEVELNMDSVVGRFDDDDYTFVFKSGQGGVVWGSTGVIENGEAKRTFSRRLVLAPGDYSINVSLSANSYLSGSTSSAGRSWANFSVSAVPEPRVALMFAVGVCLMATRRYKF
jgi:hypothetical protein